MVKLEQIAGEMSEPFGFDKYDIALEELCQKVEQNLHEILMRAEAPEGHAARGVGKGVDPGEDAAGGPRP